MAHRDIVQPEPEPVLDPPLEPGPEPSDPAPEPAGGVLRLLPYLVGIAAIAGYFVFVVALLDRAEGTSEEEWMRVIYLFSGVESIAFAAAGFLFGREVNRTRAEQAEKRASSESKRAELFRRTADKAETKGRILTREISDLADVESRAAGREAMPPNAPLAMLVRRAERLFPPV